MWLLSYGLGKHTESNSEKNKQEDKYHILNS